MRRLLIISAAAVAVTVALLCIFSYIKGVPFSFLKKEEEEVDTFDYTAGDIERQLAEAPGPFYEMPKGAVHEISTEQTCVLWILPAEEFRRERHLSSRPEQTANPSGSCFRAEITVCMN